MKKFIALLLALFLPVCAMAEAYEVTLQVQTAEKLFSMMLEPSIQRQADLDSASAEAVAKLMKALIGNTKITTVSQEDAGTVSISLNGVDFLDVTTYLSGTQTLMTSSLIPGYVLVENAAPAENAQTETKIDEDIKAAVSAWKDGLKAETTYGAFSGDAYTGGTVCTTWTITDSDIAALANAVMTPELRDMIEAEAEEDILSAIDTANRRVAEENKYTYMVRCVKDEQEQVVGLSATIFDQEKQVATLSVGETEAGVRIVVGLGMKQQNYWAECVLTQTQRDHTTYIKGEMREWTADKNESFAYVTKADAPAMSYLLNCIKTKSGQRELWDGHVYQGTKASEGKEMLSFSGSANKANQAVEAKVNLIENGESLMTFSLSGKSVADIQMPDASLVRCSENDPDQGELYTKVSQQFAFAVAMKMMQVIPFDVLMKMDGLMP